MIRGGDQCRPISLMIIGGCGRWAGVNHFPAILAMKNSGMPVRVAAIVDRHASLGEMTSDEARRVVDMDRPAWLGIDDSGDPSDHVTILDSLQHQTPCDAVIISSPPVTHLPYAEWSIARGLSVLCDKPPFLRRNSAFDPSQARLNWSDYSEILRRVEKEAASNRSYVFGTALRRRAMTPFMEAAAALGDIHERTGEGIRHLTAVVSGGLNPLPAEFLNRGAHCYSDGVGALAHSSYHYIDLVAWYLSTAYGRTRKIEISLTNVVRVRDYLAREMHAPLMRLIDPSGTAEIDHSGIDAAALAAELDCTFNINLLDESGAHVGLVTLTYNHATFSPRIRGYDPAVVDPANLPGGGRMSQLFMDIHQGSLQHIQIHKNDEVFRGNEIVTTLRRHPALGDSHERTVYADAYESERVTPRELVESFLLHAGGLQAPPYFDHLQTLQDQRLTYRLFSQFYSILAEEAVALEEGKTLRSAPIDLAEFVPLTA